MEFREQIKPNLLHTSKIQNYLSKFLEVMNIHYHIMKHVTDLVYITLYTWNFFQYKGIHQR